MDSDKFIAVPYEVFVDLVKARTERDVLLNAYVNGCEAYRIADIVSAICKINGIEVKTDAK